MATLRAVRLQCANALRVFPLAHAVMAVYISLCGIKICRWFQRHISAAHWFDGANISIFRLNFQIICQNIKIFYNYCSILPSLKSKRYRASSRAATPSILWVGTGPPFTMRRRSLLPISTAQLPNIHGHMGLAEN